MSESIIKNLVKREVSNADWGSLTRLITEENYFIDEFIIDSGKFINIERSNKYLYFIIAAGAAEFNFEEKTKTLFKGEKISFLDLEKNPYSSLNIKNCGIIPLILIKIELTR